MNTWKAITWPYDDKAATTIECHVITHRRRKLYVWRDKDQDVWNYTLQGECTGMTSSTDLLTAKADAVREAERLLT
jgi:hypothetical protein